MVIEGISISLEQVLETARNIKSLNTQEEEPAEQKVVKKVKRITIEWL